MPWNHNDIGAYILVSLINPVKHSHISFEQKTAQKCVQNCPPICLTWLAGFCIIMEVGAIPT